MNDPDLLTQIGVANGIPAEKLDGFFTGEEGKEEVRALEGWARSAGITGVPAFIINDQYLISGAQPAETLQQVFTQVAPVLQEIKMEGDSCDVNGNC
jgi:predicted DsbA family dithiol-disulfide isomerase